MRATFPLLAAFATAALAPGAVGRAETLRPESLTDDIVRAATRVLTAELYERKDPQRFWDPPSWDPDRDGQTAQAGGYTPLVVLALLHAGESYQNRRLRDAIAHLERASLDGTYAVAVRAHVWALLPDKFSDNLSGDVRWLTEAFQEHAGGWGYERQPRSGWYDNSLAQYGALGLWEAAKRGVPVGRRYWHALEGRFLDNQSPDGGWNYKDHQPVTGSMTAAGLTALFITQEFLHGPEAVDIEPDRIRPNEHAIARGLQWMDDHFTVTENPGRDTHFFYYLYGVERVGLASGYRSFGGRDWFRNGAAEIINRLCKYDPETGEVTLRRRTRGPVQVRQTAFALLFLSRGRVPVAFNKLKVDEMAWNNRPRDVANITRWLTDEMETPLNWQVVSLDDEPHQWLDAPLLYFASHQRLPWVGRAEPRDSRRGNHASAPAALAEQLGKLRRYLDLGGLLLAVNEGDDDAFSRSVEQAGRLMYPRYEWRTLPADHWAYGLLWSARGRRPPLRALSNGVRELIILSTTRDLPAVFQAGDHEQATAWAAAGHVYLYASEKNRPRPRLARHYLPPRRESGDITIARASYDGNWNPEPLALPVFATAVAESGGLKVSVVDRPLAAIDTRDPRPQVVMVSGTDTHEFTEDERRALTRYVESGGVVLFETAGGQGVFAQDAEKTAVELWDAPIDSLRNSRIVTGDGLAAATPLVHLDYRPYTHQVLAARETTPRLRGMAVGDRHRVLFTHQDITHALLDQPCWGIAGYTPESARALLANILHHAVSPVENP